MKIAQVLIADAWGGVSPDSLERGIGGREGALLRLSKEWANLGHEVTNFVPTTTTTRIQGEARDDGYGNDWHGFHEYVPSKMAQLCLATFPYDAVVAWECPKVFADERIVDLQKVRLVEMQCAHLEGESRDAAAEFATGVIGLSKWHTDFLAHSFVQGPFYVLPNGVDLEHYPWTKSSETQRRSRRFFYSSSPDRGLWNLLKIWPRIRERWPNAELKVAYGFDRWASNLIWSHNFQGEVALDLRRWMQQDGIEDMGVMGQKDLAELQRTCVAWPYPLDSIQPTETGCITAIEAMAAGAAALTTDCDCMAEEFQDVAYIVPLPFGDGSEFFDAIEETLTSRRLYADLRQSGRDFAERRQWKDLAPRWIDLFEAQRD